MGHIKTRGLVIKAINFGESSKILTVLTHDFGKIKIVANNARRGSGGKPGTQMFSYCDYSLFKGKKELYRLNDAHCIEQFTALRGDLEKLSYAAYFAEIAANVATENGGDEQLLSLLLNSIHLLCSGAVSPKKIKLVYELRGISLAGFMPDFSCCCDCSAERGITSFDLINGTIMCGNCIQIVPYVAEINDNLRSACAYITTAEINKIFYFEMSDELLEYLGNIAERYVAMQIDKELKSLEYLKKVLM